MGRGTSSVDLEAWADEILAAARPKVVAPKGPKKVQPVQQTLSLRPPAKRMAYSMTVSREDTEALIFCAKWAAEQAERMQDRSFTVSWSYAPLDGIWYAWTWAHAAESSTLARAIDLLLEHYGVKR